MVLIGEGSPVATADYERLEEILSQLDTAWTPYSEDLGSRTLQIINRSGVLLINVPLKIWRDRTRLTGGNVADVQVHDFEVPDFGRARGFGGATMALLVEELPREFPRAEIRIPIKTATVLHDSITALERHRDFRQSTHTPVFVRRVDHGLGKISYRRAFTRSSEYEAALFDPEYFSRTKHKGNEPANQIYLALENRAAVS